MIVIPMAGLSSRFTKAGYDKPKYMLPLHGKSIFWHAIVSFERYFEEELFLFIIRDVCNTMQFLEEELSELGIKKYFISVLDKETQGQAETVELGLEQVECSGHESLTIFNIDSFRKEFSLPSSSWFGSSDGYLEVFRGSGNNWSYVEACKDSDSPVVKRTTEKDPISDLCSNGLYYFARADSFLAALEVEKRKGLYKELYIAPLYNHLISANKTIHYNEISAGDTVFCGVPAEYDALRHKSYIFI